MRRKNFLPFAAVLLISVATATGLAQNEPNIANVVGGGSGVRWEIIPPNGGGTLTITFPDGRAIRKTIRAGGSPQVSLGEKYFENLPDGTYTYELQLAPVISSAQREALQKARGKDDDPENERAARKRPALPGLVQAGSFAVVNGSIIVAGAAEREAAPPKASAKPGQKLSGISIRSLRSHHFSLFSVPDVVTADDEIIQGSLCVGLDCVNNENFGFDTIRTKENNTRIQFDDTSTSAGFPTNNWQIRANSSASGGGSFLGFVDQGSTSNSETGTLVFQVTAGASANSVNVGSNSKVGFRTATPVLDLHMNTSDTPAVRFEQNNSGGFTAQTWDVAGNEANFFVRDVTSGSRLPFRIRPGAPTSSIDIAASGNVGVANASPNAQLHVIGTGNNVFAGEFDQTNVTASNGVIIKTQTTNAGDAALHVASNNGVNVVMSARNNGNVGIGTAAPTQTLSVNGTAGKPGGGSWDVFSDERLKNIKGRFNLGLNAVMRLHPIRYEYKPDNALGLKLSGEQVGFGAQELRKVIPEAVKTNSAGFLMVNNDPIIWTMLNAIKEQQKEIADLKAQVGRLSAHSRRHRR